MESLWSNVYERFIRDFEDDVFLQEKYKYRHIFYRVEKPVEIIDLIREPVFLQLWEEDL